MLYHFPSHHTLERGADGLLYVVTGEDQGALLRIEPGEPVQ